MGALFLRTKLLRIRVKPDPRANDAGMLWLSWSGSLDYARCLMGEYRFKEKLRQDQIESIRKKLLRGEDDPIFVREAMDGSWLCGSTAGMPPKFLRIIPHN